MTHRMTVVSTRNRYPLWPRGLLEIKGCPSVGGRTAVRAKYANAQDKKFAEVVPCIFETFGGFEHEVVEPLNDWAARARQRRPRARSRRGRPATSQSSATPTVQRGAAVEILSRVREETAARSAMHARSG